MEAVQEMLLFTKQSKRRRRHQKPELQKDLTASRVKPTIDGPQDRQLVTTNFSDNTSKLHNLVACDSNEASNDQTGLKELTKTQLRNFIASNEIAKSIVQELVDLKAASASQSLNEIDLVRHMIANPVLGETFAFVAREALENYKALCKDSYMQALRDVEKDNKAWLQAHRHSMGIKGMEVHMERSPAQVALQSPHDWPVPEIPRSSLEAIAATNGEADAAKVRLRSAVKRNINDWMDQGHVEKRLMRHMRDGY